MSCLGSTLRNSEDWVWSLVLSMLRKVLNLGPRCSSVVTRYPGHSAYRLHFSLHYSPEGQDPGSHQTLCWGPYTWDGIGAASGLTRLLLGTKPCTLSDKSQWACVDGPDARSHCIPSTQGFWTLSGAEIPSCVELGPSLPQPTFPD